MPASDLLENRLLAGLPSNELDRLAPLVEVVDVEIKTAVYEPGGPIDLVYFPLDAVFSLVAGVGSAQVEVATIGREGMVGLPVFLGARVSPNRAFSQVPGRTARLGADQLTGFLHGADGDLHDRLHRYTQATIIQLAQSVACNQLHSTQQRAARWLLTTMDRVGSATFPLTQEFLAQMLGVRRATVSEIAARLQDKSLITYTRGVITIVDQRRLSALSCACYEIVEREYARLLSAAGDA